MAGAIRELVQHIATVHPEYDRDGMLDAIYAQEKRMNTGIMPGIAVPHGRYAPVSRVMGAVGISPAGIPYGAPDGKPVHIVFMLFTDNVSHGEHLSVFRQLLLLLKSPYALRLREARTPQEVYNVLARY
ncbi:MAG: PTS sugar transporter subunit IIA [Spirochaetaceae bacterium]|jgi:PTS system nitrogen regulatory IIA component|nr:PTS sugar transporter subunit IIA [Spirochaetaceae bacterium]